MTITSSNFYQSSYYQIQKSQWGALEFPLWKHHKLCPKARYVGGVSEYLCECVFPAKCPGALAAANHFQKWWEEK